MLLLILFAFFAGIVTILSPCILPVLPLILSSSVTGGKRRPLGVATGFVASFTFFTLFLTSIVQATGLSADLLRNISVAVVALFGLSLLIPQFQTWTEILFSKLSSRLPTPKNAQGFAGGLLVGASLGLVWTPCVGPILASVISLALTGSVTGSAVLITLAYSLGTAIPLLGITYGGQRALKTIPFLAKKSARIQQVFGVIMILTAAALFFQIDRAFQTKILELFPQYGTGLTQFEENKAVQEQLEKLRGKESMGLDSFFAKDSIYAPEIVAGGEWFNSEPLKLADLRGKVVLIDFWTYTCINCIRTLPYIQRWHETYKDQGLVIIGVHTPEFEFEKNPSNVGKAIKDFGLTYPTVQDNDYATWKAYDNHYWPAKYFIDKDGKIRDMHFGEGDYDGSEKLIQELLQETGAQISEKPNNPTYDVRTRTPETYLGWQRMRGLVSPERVTPNLKRTYSAPPTLSLNTFAFAGDWTIGGELSKAEPGSALVFSFESQEVFLVMRPTDKPARVRVLLDGEVVGDEAGVDVKAGIVTVDSDRLYRLIKLSKPSHHDLRLEFLDGGVEVFAFTFG